MSWLLSKVLMRVETGLLVCVSPPICLLPRTLFPILPLRLLVPLSLALVCFGSSSAVHVVRVSRLLSVRDGSVCDTGGGVRLCVRG